MTYVTQARKHADPAELAKVSRGLAGLANWIEIVDSNEE